MKFIIDNIGLLGLTLVSGCALIWPTLQRRGEKVSTLQATQLINRGKTAILDVRDATEFAIAHLKDAINIPLSDLSQRMSELEKYKSKTIVVICQSGVRSAKATTQLKKAGFNEVYSLDGGLESWHSQGLPTTK